MVKIISTAFLCSFLFYFPDWLFQRTGNMPLAVFEPEQAYLSLSMGLLIFALGLFLYFAAIQGTAALVKRVFAWNTRHFVHWFKILPVAGAFALTAVLLVNNFTTTVWGFNLASLSGTPFKYLYLAALVALGIYFLFELNTITKTKLYTSRKVHTALAVVGLFSVLPAFVLTLKEKLNPAESSLKYSSKFTSDELPNILFLQGDGIDAQKLSVYGFEKQTTPFLDSIKNKMNVWTNFYPSNCCTYGAHYALLTGIHPLTTNVYYPPAQVPTEQTLLSLPQILKSIGYVTYQDTVPYFADASFMGLTSAFTYGNETLEGQHPLKKFLLAFLPNQSFNWVRSARRTVLRHTNTLKVLAAGTSFADGIQLVEAPQTITEHPDVAKVARVTSFIKNQHKAWFLQVHLMGTHGPQFLPKKPFFSANKLPQYNWQHDFYLDAIRDWDSDVEKIISTVQAAANKRPTWIFITSDHGMAWDSTKKIPLLTLKVSPQRVEPLFQGNVDDKLNSLLESIDLPKTVSLELGIEPQALWMQGNHLLESKMRNFIVAANSLKIFIAEGIESIGSNKNETFSSVSRLSLMSASGTKQFQTLDSFISFSQFADSLFFQNTISIPLRSPSQIAIHQFKESDSEQMKESLSELKKRK